MKIKKICLASILILAILTIGTVSASEDVNLTASDGGEDAIVETPADNIEINQADFENENQVLSDDNFISAELKNSTVEYNGEITVNVNVIGDVEGYVYGYIDQDTDNYEYELYGYSDSFTYTLNVGEIDFGKHTLYLKYYGGNHKDTILKLPFEVKGYHMDFEDMPFDEWGNDVTIDFYMPSTARGTITLNFNGKTYTTRSDDELGFRITIKKEDLAYGINNVTATFTPASKYSKFEQKTITKTMIYRSSIHFDDNNIEYDGDNVITLLLPQDAKGKLQVSIDGTDYTVDHEKGKFTFHYPLLDLKEYNVKAKYLGDDYKVDYEYDYWNDCEGTFKEEYITVLPKLDIKTKGWDRQNFNVSVVMPSKYNGKVTFYRDYDNSVKINAGTATIKDGVGSMPVKLVPGGHSIEGYVECGDYNAETYQKDAEILYESSSWNINLKLNNMIMKNGYQTLGEFIKENWNFDPNFTLKIDGSAFEDFYVDSTDVYINASKLSYGKHSFELEFLGDDYFLYQKESGSFEIGDVNIYIPESSIIDNDVKVELPLDATGSVEVYKNGKLIENENLKYYTDNIDENDRFITLYLYYFDDYERSEYGLADITVKVKGKYTASVSAKTNITKFFSIADIITYGESKLELFYSFGDGTGELSVLIDGKSYPISYDDDDYEHLNPYVNVEGFSIGEHDIIATYSGDTYVPPIKTEKKFEIIPQIIYNEDIHKGEGISLTMPEDATGDLAILVDNKLYKSVKAKGKVFVTLDDLSIGDHKLEAMYTGNDYYVRAQSAKTVKIYPAINVPERIFWNEGASISISVPGKEGSLKIEYWDSNYDTHEIEKELISGKASIPISKLPLGTNSVNIHLTIRFMEDEEDEIEDEEYFDWYYEISVIKPIVSSSSVVYSSDYKIKIQDINAKALAKTNVAVYLNGKKVKTVQTDSKGYAYYKITQAPKTYTLKLVSGAHSITQKLKVTHIVTLKGATVKKSAKKLVLQATLKKVNGKYLKNKKITFKFNGKKYTAKTNKKGIAKVTVKSNVLKKLKVGKKIAYQATYLKDTVKKTAKVKK